MKTVAKSLVLVLWAWLICQCLGEKKTVPLNEDSSLASSISSIVIDTDQRLVIIDLQPIRQCDDPTFVVRLSGTALYKLKLERQDYTPRKREGEYLFLPRKNTYYFTYPPIQDTGLYFLDVVAVLCETFRPHNFVGNCVVDYWRGRNIVTAENSIMLTAYASAIKTPRWVLSDSSKLAVLPTRVQHRTCPVIAGEDSTCEFRQDMSELWQHLLYEWVDNPDWRVVYHNIGTPAAKVCFVGASHARELTHNAKLLDCNGTKVEFHHIDSRFPESFPLKSIDENHCDYAVVGYGQWPLSWQLDVPYNDERYRTAMKDVLSQMDEAGAVGKTKFFVRSTNYNGLSSTILMCPPVDHRLPPAIDSINSILAELAHAFQVPYIDLNHIMGPMWDSAIDYCHPPPRVFTAEVEWILNSIFTATEGVAPRLVRFTDSSTVYLVQHRVARAFPNGATFMKMGFDFADVAVLHTDERVDYVFSDDLPSL